MAEVTSKINPISIDTSGSGNGAAAFMKKVYTATKVTGPTGTPPTYQSEIIRYSDAKGNDPIVIGTRDPSTGQITFNDNASSTDKKGSAQITKASTTQMNSAEIQALASNASQTAALNASAGQGNQAQGNGDNQSTPAARDTNEDSKSAGGTRERGFPHLVFPESLTTIDRDVLKMTMVKYNPSGMGKGTGAATLGGRGKKKTEIGSVMLPVPGGISDTQSVDWGSGTMNPIQAAAANVAMKTLQDGLKEGANAAVGEIKDAVNNSDDVKKGIASVIAGSATQIGKQALQRGEGMVLNPNMELLFNGPQLRTFGFTFKLSPRSSREAQTVVKIIKFFKQGMSPIRSESNFFLKAPHTFTLKYMMGKGRGEQKYLNKFKECALQNCTVQYTPDGNYNTFTDGIMTSYSLQLTFNELTPVFNDDYGNGSFDATIGY